MKKFSLIITTVLFSFGVLKVANAVVAPDGTEASHNVVVEVPTVALVDVENSSGDEANITFNITEENLVSEAGSAVDFSDLSNSGLYLQYTSVISGEATNKITAQLSSSDIPAGLSLKLTTAAGITGGQGKGNLGEGQGLITLTSSPHDVVTSIGSCYTSTGGSYGHQLTYELEIADTNEAYQALTSDSYTATVLYTITGE